MGIHGFRSWWATGTSGSRLGFRLFFALSRGSRLVSSENSDQTKLDRTGPDQTKGPGFAVIARRGNFGFIFVGAEGWCRV